MVLCSSHAGHDTHPPGALSPLSATALRPFRLVCRNRRQFGSRAAMNVSRRPFCVQTACRRSDQDPGSAGADLWRRRGVALFDSRYGRVPPVVSRRFRKNWIRTPVDKSLRGALAGVTADGVAGVPISGAMVPAVANAREPRSPLGLARLQPSIRRCSRPCSLLRGRDGYSPAARRH
jgi:hypothetical protein